MTYDSSSLASAMSAAAGLVTREVRTGSRGGAATRIVVATRTYATDRRDLWDALTNAERLPRWFLPVSGDLSAGGRYQFVGNAGGTIERCDPPQSFAVTWEMGPTTSWLTISLSEQGSTTTLELVHEAPVDPDFWNQFGPGAVGVGWDLALAGLGVHIETNQAIDPEMGAAFATTPEGTAFVQTAAADWARAATADGDGATAADEAAQRTIAFYTAAPEHSPDGHSADEQPADEHGQHDPTTTP